VRSRGPPGSPRPREDPDDRLRRDRHASTVPASARITSTRVSTTDTARRNAAKCPHVVNGSLTGSEHHRSRSEGTLRRHRSNHDASSPRRDRAPASRARPSPIPPRHHHDRSRTASRHRAITTSSAPASRQAAVSSSLDLNRTPIIRACRDPHTISLQAAAGQ
jgi:hypothetical protein